MSERDNEEYLKGFDDGESFGKERERQRIIIIIDVLKGKAVGTLFADDLKKEINACAAGAEVPYAKDCVFGNKETIKKNIEKEATR